jgi:hypothetical protein
MNNKLYESIIKDISKIVKKRLNEKLGETNTWTYLCMGQEEGVSFFRGHDWSPHETYNDIKDKFVIVNTDKNLNTDERPIERAWKRKYDEERPKWFNIVLRSVGDKQYAKYIQKIGKALDSGKITIEDLFDAKKSFNGPTEDEAEYVYKQLFK